MASSLVCYCGQPCASIRAYNTHKGHCAVYQRALREDLDAAAEDFFAVPADAVQPASPVSKRGRSSSFASSSAAAAGAGSALKRAHVDALAEAASSAAQQRSPERDDVNDDDDCQRGDAVGAAGEPQDDLLGANDGDAAVRDPRLPA